MTGRTAILTMIVVGATTMGAQAQVNPSACAERSSIVDQLKGKYQEAHRATGMQTDERLVEIWTSSASGSWTILITDVNGTSCIAAAGKGWLDMMGAPLPTGQSS